MRPYEGNILDLATLKDLRSDLDGLEYLLEKAKDKITKEAIIGRMKILLDELLRRRIELKIKRRKDALYKTRKT